ncbi:Ger(x)C family spore germination protein [Fonticella tunisiensis]|uniref:Spore germination protein KC n=1 Tax=Fonticella tunisiensis TaxID=1096341 RepID=A0A4R7KQB6_9CLOT|nr:Ger(x)C family spore germination protein [Fonticella tunisiensis]TDT61311.1 spore germination protein KC [Fonticella tunisiensis]
MKKGMALIITLIMLTNFLTGCWSKRELNELAIASAIGIDKSGDGYQVTVEVINPSEISAEKGTGQRSPVVIFSATGKTVFEALRRITLESPRRVYLSHIRVVVLGEELARDGIAKIIDFLSRDSEFRIDFYILAAKNTKAESVLKVLTQLEKIPANKIAQGLEISEKSWSSTHAVKLDELTNDFTSDGKNPVLTGITLSGNADTGMTLENLKSSKLSSIQRIGNLAVFKKDRLVGWLSEEESLGYNYVMGNVKSTITTVECPGGGKLSVEVLRTKSNIKGKIENGKPKAKVELSMEGNIGESECDLDLTKPENIRQIEDALEEVVKEKKKLAIGKAQNLGSDIFGFGETIRRENPKAWKELKEKWNEEFERLSVDVSVDAKIRRTGTITNSPEQTKSKK